MGVGVRGTAGLNAKRENATSVATKGGWITETVSVRTERGGEGA